jgi:phosphate transport system ATP-binding protein
VPGSALTASLQTKNLDAYYGDRQAVAGVTVEFQPFAVTALLGPSGCGKTTLLRALNRIHEVTPGAYVRGNVLLDKEDVYRADVDPIVLRRRIGMVFQRPNPFPTLSIAENVVAGVDRRVNRKTRLEIVERSLQVVGLWQEVRDRLHSSALTLSGGQQQRLCVARAVAVEPEVLLMDEPTSSLDPASTSNIEELIAFLKRNYTIVVVTHNMQQAARISDFAVFMLAGDDGAGRVIEAAETRQLFFKPQDHRTEDYITGRFG